MWRIKHDPLGGWKHFGASSNSKFYEAIKKILREELAHFIFAYELWPIILSEDNAEVNLQFNSVSALHTINEEKYVINFTDS